MKITTHGQFIEHIEDDLDIRSITWCADVNAFAEQWQTVLDLKWKRVSIILGVY